MSVGTYPFLKFNRNQNFRYGTAVDQRCYQQRRLTAGANRFVTRHNREKAKYHTAEREVS